MTATQNLKPLRAVVVIIVLPLFVSLCKSFLGFLLSFLFCQSIVSDCPYLLFCWCSGFTCLCVLGLLGVRDYQVFLFLVVISRVKTRRFVVSIILVLTCEEKKRLGR